MGNPDYSNSGSGYTSVNSQPIVGADLSRVLPRQNSTGSTRGTQQVGQGGSAIDGSNNRIIIQAPDGSSVGIGNIPSTNNEYGFFSLDPSGKLIMKIVNGTRYIYNPQDSFNNVMQDGILPDGSGGWAVASKGNNVADGFS